MIKARIRWCTCRVENILTLGKLLSLWFSFLLHSILFLISQTSYRTYKIISSYELARPIMGTIFLVCRYIIGRAGIDSPTSPTLAGPYFRGALIRWAWHRRTKSDQIDGWSVQLLSRRRFERKYLWEKKLVPQLGIEPLPFACEASALTTEPS